MRFNKKLAMQKLHIFILFFFALSRECRELGKKAGFFRSQISYPFFAGFAALYPSTYKIVIYFHLCSSYLIDMLGYSIKQKFDIS
jgi:hypothetical protein